MTHEKILTKAIQKADKGGFGWGDGYNACKFKFHGGVNVGSKNSSFYIPHLESWWSLIFSHDFAKAFWGESHWKYHLQQMVLEKDPISYLEKFL